MGIVEHRGGELTCGVFEVLQVNAHRGNGFIAAGNDTARFLCSATGQQHSGKHAKGNASDFIHLCRSFLLVQFKGFRGFYHPFRAAEAQRGKADANVPQSSSA